MANWETCSNGARLRGRRWRERHHRRRKRVHHCRSHRWNYEVRSRQKKNRSVVATCHSSAPNPAAVRYKTVCYSGFPASWNHSHRLTAREPRAVPLDGPPRRSRRGGRCPLQTARSEGCWRSARTVRRSGANHRSNSRPHPRLRWPHLAQRLLHPCVRKPRRSTRQPGARTAPVPRSPDSDG